MIKISRPSLFVMLLVVICISTYSFTNISSRDTLFREMSWPEYSGLISSSEVLITNKEDILSVLANENKEASVKSSVAGTTFTLTVNVYNVGRTPLPGSGGSIHVLLYNSTWSLIYYKNVDFVGEQNFASISFDGLQPGVYTIEVYQKPSISGLLMEFWGSKQVIISSNTSLDFVRSSPYLHGIYPHGGLTLKPGLVNPYAIVRNIETVALSVIVELRIFSLTGDLLYNMNSTRVIVPAGGIYNITLPSINLPQGIYRFIYIVWADYQGVGKYVATDQCDIAYLTVSTIPPTVIKLSPLSIFELDFSIEGSDVDGDGFKEVIFEISVPPVTASTWMDIIVSSYYGRGKVEANLLSPIPTDLIVESSTNYIIFRIPGILSRTYRLIVIEKEKDSFVRVMVPIYKVEDQLITPIPGIGAPAKWNAIYLYTAIDEKGFSPTIWEISPQIVVVNPGDEFELQINFTIRQFSYFPPGIIWQVYLVYSWSPSWPPPIDYYVPLYDSIPPYEGENIVKTVIVKAPENPGEYYIWVGVCQHYSTDLAISGIGEPPTLPAHVKIVVQQPQPIQTLTPIHTLTPTPSQSPPPTPEPKPILTPSPTPTPMPTQTPAITPTIGTPISIDISVETPNYVAINRTEVIEVSITNKENTVIEATIEVKSMFRYLEVAQPIGNYTFRIPPKQTYRLNIVVLGVREGEEVLTITVSIPQTGDILTRALHIPVTRLRTVYINLYASFRIAFIEFYRRPETAEIHICNTLASRIRDNLYVAEIPSIYSVCLINVEKSIIGIRWSPYKERVLVTDSIDLVVPDITLSLSQTVLAWILFIPLVIGLKKLYYKGVYYSASMVSFLFIITFITLWFPELFLVFYYIIIEILAILIIGTKLVAEKIRSLIISREESKKERTKEKIKEGEEKTLEREDEKSSEELSMLLQSILKEHVPEPHKKKAYTETITVPEWVREFLKKVGNELPSEMYLIGCGSWGCVYACGSYAIKVPLGLRDVIKSGSKILPTVKEGLVREIMKEVEVLSGLDHDNILKLVDYSVNPPILVYELADGSLEDYEKLYLRDILLISIQICEALRYLHSRGVVHGDLKPSNILVAKGFVKIGDFSSMTHLLRTFSKSSRTTTCTPGYCAPEQLFIDLKEDKRRRTYENRVDIYQLANVILFMMDVVPLDGSMWSTEEVDKRIKNIEIEELKDLVKAMLVKEPWLRPSAEDVEKKLLDIWGKYVGEKG